MVCLAALATRLSSPDPSHENKQGDRATEQPDPTHKPTVDILDTSMLEAGGTMVATRWLHHNHPSYDHREAPTGSPDAGRPSLSDSQHTF